nr:MAG TPA: hypothetical protein [Caudoviricetes sp.]
MSSIFYNTQRRMSNIVDKNKIVYYTRQKRKREEGNYGV